MREGGGRGRAVECVVAKDAARGAEMAGDTVQVVAVGVALEAVLARGVVLGRWLVLGPVVGVLLAVVMPVVGAAGVWERKVNRFPLEKYCA